MSKIMILIGILFIVIGILFSFNEKIPFIGHLPGDIHIKLGHTEIYFPIISCVIVSLIGSLILNIFFKR